MPLANDGATEQLCFCFPSVFGKKVRESALFYMVSTDFVTIDRPICNILTCLKISDKHKVMA